MKNRIIIGMVLVVMVVLFYLQYGRDVYVCCTGSYGTDDGITEEVTICANRLFIGDTEEFAQEIIERYIDNSFKEVYFSKDKGEVTEVKFHIYLNRYDRYKNREFFEIVYIPE